MQRAKRQILQYHHHKVAICVLKKIISFPVLFKQASEHPMTHSYTAFLSVSNWARSRSSNGAADRSCSSAGEPTLSSLVVLLGAPSRSGDAGELIRSVTNHLIDMSEPQAEQITPRSIYYTFLHYMMTYNRS